MRGYLIFESLTRADLIKQINEGLNRGFVCQGGVCVTAESDNYSKMFYQAMILEK